VSDIATVVLKMDFKLSDDQMIA